MKLLNMLAVAGLFLAVPTVGSRTGEAARPNKHTRAISRATRRPVTIWERMRDPHGWWQSRFASPNPQRADSRTRPFATSARPFAGGGVANPIFFVPPTFPSGGKFAANVAIGDFNGDGKPDLLVSNQCVSDADCSQGSVAVLLGNGNGTYQPALVSNTGAVFSSLAIGDFNGDGKLDVAVSNACPDVGCASGSVNILLGNGDGSFQPPVAYASGGNAFSVEAGDVNGDGKLDLVVVNSSNTAGILLGNGDGTFKPVASFTTSASGNSAVFLGDFNGDNKLDAAVVTADCGTSSCDTVVSVLPGNGDGTFQAPAGSQSFSQLDPQAVALGDVNGDGRLDLAVVEACSSPSCTLEPETVNVLLGNGNGTFGNIKSSLLLATPDVTFIRFGDFDGDSKPDLVTVGGDASATVMLGAGDGTFRFLNGYETVGASPVFGALGDLNGDGKLDLAVANGCQLTDQNTCTGAVLALLGNGNGTLQAAPDYPVPAGSNLQSVVAADFDGDGRLDLAQLATQANGASFPTASVSVLLGQADGTFVAGPSTPAGVSVINLFNAIPMVAGDFNQDGKIDLAITGCLDQTCDNFGLIVLLGKGNGAFQPPLLLTPLPTVSLAVADLNGDGKLDLVGATNSCSSPDVCDSGSLNILLGNGDGTFQAPLTFPFTGTLTSSVSVSDLNHDGKLDVVVASGNCGEPDCPPGELSVFLGNGNGTFQTAVNYSSGDFGAYSVAIGDFNGDGKSDLAVSNAGRCTSFPCGVTSIGILLGNGDGSFQAATTFPSSSEPLPEFVGDVRAIAAADLDGDGARSCSLQPERAAGQWRRDLPGCPELQSRKQCRCRRSGCRLEWRRQARPGRHHQPFPDRPAQHFRGRGAGFPGGSLAALAGNDFGWGIVHLHNHHHFDERFQRQCEPVL
jgi:hypothetical protein